MKRNNHTRLGWYDQHPGQVAEGDYSRVTSNLGQSQQAGNHTQSLDMPENPLRQQMEYAVQLTN